MSSNEASNPERPELTLQQSQAFDEIIATFASPGWRHLQRELDSQRESIGNVRNTKDLAFTHGQLSILDVLSNWRDLWENLYAAAQRGDVEVSPEFGK